MASLGVAPLLAKSTERTKMRLPRYRIWALQKKLAELSSQAEALILEVMSSFPSVVLLIGLRPPTLIKVTGVSAPGKSKRKLPLCYCLLQSRQLLIWQQEQQPVQAHTLELTSEDQRMIEQQHRTRLASIIQKHCMGMLRVIASHKVWALL